MSDVTLREFIERIIAENNLRRDDLRREDKCWLNAAVARIEDKFKVSVAEVDKARSLQAAEYERRLEALNHAHAEAQRVLHTYVTKSVYDKDIERLNELRQRVEVEFGSMAGKAKGVAMIGAVVYSAVIATAALAGVLLTLLR